MSPAGVGGGDDIKAQSLRFLLFGAFNTVLTYLIYCLLVFSMHPQVAYAIVFACGVLLAYWGNSHFVFRREMRVKIAAAYPLVYLLQYLLTAGLIHSFGDWLQMGPRVALAIALVIVTPLSFLLNRVLVNRAPPLSGGPS